jgi:NhaP-type Na+/H+ or K+/H+ antiporter
MGFLIQIVIGLVILGLFLWIFQQIPMDPALARIVRIVVVVLVVVWMIYLLADLLGGIPVVPFRR